MPLEEIHEWDQYPQESSEAFRAFNCYKRLPAHRRSVNEAWKLYNPEQSREKPDASGTFSRWPKRFDWKMRAEAYDAHLEKLRDDTKEGAFVREQLEEREDRRRMMKVVKHYFGMYANQLNKKVEAGTLEPNDIRALTEVMRVYSDQSRTEYHEKGVTHDGEDQSETIEKLGKGIRKKVQQELSRLTPPKAEPKDSGIVQ